VIQLGQLKITWNLERSPPSKLKTTSFFKKDATILHLQSFFGQKGRQLIPFSQNALEEQILKETFEILNVIHPVL